jgi:5-methyltetrahydrofolate--homocysteine methyltransferase
MDVAAVGVNCGRTLEENLAALTAMRAAAPHVTLVTKPNAGLPRMEDTVEAVYDVTPEIMADYARKFAALRVKMLGGCCGSTPAHITAIKEALDGFTPPPLETVLAEIRSDAANGSDSKAGRQRRSSRRRERT